MEETQYDNALHPKPKRQNHASRGHRPRGKFWDFGRRGSTHETKAAAEAVFARSVVAKGIAGDKDVGQISNEPPAPINSRGLSYTSTSPGWNNPAYDKTRKPVNVLKLPWEQITQQADPRGSGNPEREERKIKFFGRR